MPGATITAQMINDRAGSLVLGLDQLFAQNQRFIQFLNRLGGGTITVAANATAAIAALQTAAGGSMSVGDATAVVNVFVRIAQLTAIYNGNAALATAHDFGGDVATLTGAGI